MSNVIANVAKTLALLVAIPVVSLLAYDLIAIQPRLGQIESILASAPKQDASPPHLIRKMIDANAGSPSTYATNLVISRVYPESPGIRWHMRNALWRLLLPLHVGKTGMYGLYATLAFNGTDYGLTNFANREFAKPLDQLSQSEAATTVAITFMPSSFIKDRQRLSRHAEALLQRAGTAP